MGARPGIGNDKSRSMYLPALDGSVATAPVFVTQPNDLGQKARRLRRPATLNFSHVGRATP